MSQPASPGVWQAFGLAVIMAMVEARQDAVVEAIAEVSAEELWKLNQLPPSRAIGSNALFGCVALGA